MQKKIKVIFFGTPDIGLKSLEYLTKSDRIQVDAVVTQPDKPAGRGKKIQASPIKQFALSNNIPVFQPVSIKKDLDIQQKLKQYNPDFFVTFAFGQILSQEVLDIPKFETINLHASLLPKYRGANPVQRVIIDGETQTGICTMITELGLDCGDICLKKIIDISQTMTCVDLWDKISQDSPKILEETLIGIYEGTLNPQKQSDNGVCIAKKLAKEECKIDWNKPSFQIHNLVRGIYKSPGAYFVYNNKIIKVLKTELSDNIKCDCETCGQIVKVDKDGLYFSTKDGLLKVLTVKPEGKGEMSAKDWYNGVKNVKNN